jgi:endonuclease YncB( thermonuclease family)
VATVGEPYTYNATVVRVVDGDTVVLDVSLGFGLWLRSSPPQPMSFRLAGCNARELRAPGGREARDYLTGLLPAGSGVRLRSVVNDKYGGRFDTLLDVPGVGNLTEHLIGAGWVARWDGNGAAPHRSGRARRRPPPDPGEGRFGFAGRGRISGTGSRSAPAGDCGER